MIAEIAHNKQKSLSPREEVQAQRQAMLDQISTGSLLWYLVWRHRAFILASGYIVGPVLYLVLRYR